MMFDNENVMAYFTVKAMEGILFTENVGSYFKELCDVIDADSLDFFDYFNELLEYNERNQCRNRETQVNELFAKAKIIKAFLNKKKSNRAFNLFKEKLYINLPSFNDKIDSIILK